MKEVLGFSGGITSCISQRMERHIIWLLSPLLLLGTSSVAHAQFEPTDVCVEYLTAPSATQYVAHFSYLNQNNHSSPLETDNPFNFMTPVSEPAGQPAVFYPGYHPNVFKVLLSMNTDETWFLGAGQQTSISIPSAIGQNQNSGTNTVTPSHTCSAIFLPGSGTYAVPGTYTHQYLGQVDSGPAVDASSIATVTSFMPNPSNIAVSNLTYVPNDSANPVGSLNPNSIYGDVTVGYGPNAAMSARLQLAVNGKVIVKGIDVLNYTGPVAAPTPSITFSVTDHTFGDAPFSLTAKSTSGAAITYSVVSGPASVAGSQVTLTGTGLVLLAANQTAVPGTYSAGVQEATFNVNKATATVKLGSLAQTYTGSPLSATAMTTPSGLSVLYIYNGSTSTAPSAIGSYSVVASILGANYQGSATGTLVISGPVAGTVVLTTTTALSKVTGGGFKAVVTITNTGTGTAQNVTLTSATLGAASGETIPASLGSITSHGGTAVVTLTFPASAGASGSTVLEKLTGAYTGGSVSVSARAVLP